MPLVAAHEIPSLGHIHNDVLCPLFLERRNKERLCSTWHSSEWLIEFFYEAEALKVFIDRTNVEMETRSWWGGCEVLGDLGIVYLDSNIVKPYYTKYCNYLELSSKAFITVIRTVPCPCEQVGELISFSFDAEAV